MDPSYHHNYKAEKPAAIIIIIKPNLINVILTKLDMDKWLKAQKSVTRSESLHCEQGIKLW